MIKAYFTTIEGRLALNKSMVAAVVELKEGSANVSCQIYIKGDKDPYNVIEKFDDVMERLK